VDGVLINTTNQTGNQTNGKISVGSASGMGSASN